MLNLERGTQVTYIPWHASGNIDHPDCEDGFVTSIQANGTHEQVAYVRYFAKGKPDILRTKANSERTPLAMLVVRDHHLQSEIDALLRAYC